MSDADDLLLTLEQFSRALQVLSVPSLNSLFHSQPMARVKQAAERPATGEFSSREFSSRGFSSRGVKLSG